MASTSDTSRGTDEDAAAGVAVREDLDLAADERRVLANPALENFAHYTRFSTAATRVFFVKVYRGAALCGVAPVMVLARRRCTDLLRPAARRWLAPLLGPFARKTIYMVDTALLGYDHSCPFYAVDPQDRQLVRTSVCEYLKSRRDAQILWIAEPEADPSASRAAGFDVFSILPTVQVDLGGAASLEAYLKGLSRKRRRNYQQERDLFRDGGGTIEIHRGPLDPSLAESMLHCLRQSAERSQFTVPYADVLNHEAAFRAQPQHALVAKVGDRVAGFFSFFRNGDCLQQCHGGLDYDLSLKLKAYHNLIYAAIERAIALGLRRVSMGPLNNETKRRAGTHLLPCMAGLWCREPLVRWVNRWLFIKNFQVYTGPAPPLPSPSGRG